MPEKNISINECSRMLLTKNSHSTNPSNFYNIYFCENKPFILSLITWKRLPITVGGKDKTNISFYNVFHALEIKIQFVDL